jgi:hypothetical protein
MPPDNITVNIDSSAAGVIATAIKTAIEKVLKPSSSTSGGGNTPDFGSLAGSALQATGALAGISAPGHEAAAALKLIGGAVPLVGGQLAQLATTLEEGRVSTNKSFQQGIGGLSLFDLPIKARDAGLGLDEYRQALQRSGGALNGIGPTAQASSEQLLALGKKVKDLDLDQGVKSLQRSNAMQADELAKVTLLSQFGRRTSLNSQEAQDQAAAASLKLSNEIIRQAGVTGKSTLAIEQELEERLKQPEVMGAMRQMTDKQRESFVQNQVALSGMGNTVQGLSATLGVNGRMTQEQQYALAAMGPAAGEFQRASRMAAMAQTEDQKKQAEAAMLKAKADINAYQSSAQFSRVMNSATGPMADAFKKSYAENQLRDRQAAGQQVTGESGTTTLKRAEKAVDMTVAGQKMGADGKPERDLGQTTAREMADVQIRARDNTVGLMKALQGFDAELAKDQKTLDQFHKAVSLIYGPGGDTDKLAAAYKKSMKDALDAVGAVRSGNSGTGNGTPNPNRPPPGSNNIPAPPGQAAGSKDTFGDWFAKDWGSGGLSELHGKEAVVPQSKIGEFMKDMMSSMSKPKQPAPQIDLPNVPSSPENPTTGAGSGDNVTLKDVLASLNQLNKTMGQVASHSESISDASNKTARLSSKATGNRMAV